MKRTAYLWSTLIVISAITLASCAGHIRVDGSVASPNGKLELAIVARGESGKSFVDRGPKEIYLSVSDRGSDPPNYRFKKQIQLVAGSLDWHIEWQSPEKVKVTFFDSSSSTGNEKRPILELVLVQESSGAFVESKG